MEAVRQLGHTHVCLGCGRSVLDGRRPVRHHTIEANDPLISILCSWNTFTEGNAYLERYPLPPVFKTIGACARHPSLPRFGHAAPVEIHTLTRSLCRSTASDIIFRRL
ncbi:hypothetical protein ACJJTC_005356 [Scirpophaga incertulas]